MTFWSTNLGGDVCSITKYISIWKLHWGMADDDSISITLIAFEYFEHFWILLNTLPTSNSWRGLWRTSLKQWCSLLVSPSSRSSMWWVCGDDHEVEDEDWSYSQADHRSDEFQLMMMRVIKKTMILMIIQSTLIILQKRVDDDSVVMGMKTMMMRMTKIITSIVQSTVIKL